MANPDSAPLAITVTTSSGKFQYCEDTAHATLSALRTAILSGAVLRDAPTLVETRGRDGAYAFTEGPLIKCATPYAQIADLYVPLRRHALAGLRHGGLIGVLVSLVVFAFVVFRRDTATGVLLLAIPACGAIAAFLVSRPLASRDAWTIASALGLFAMAIAGYLGFKGGTFTFGGLVGVAVSGILISLPGMVIGTVVAVVRRPHLARAADARTENALLHLIVQLAITAVFWISFFYLAEYVFSTPDRMFEAVRTGDLKQAESLIQYNHDLALSRTYPGGSTPLHEAVSLGRRDIAELLLSKGDQVNARNYMHRTPLHIAAATGSKSMVELLLANKADVNVRDERGEMPLHRATLGLDKDIFRILLVNGADINAKGYNGWTPLYYAAGYCQHEVTHQAFTDPQTFVEFLLDNNADVNARDGVGETPLHAAVRCGSRGVVELLLNHHADVNARARIGLDVSGMTPLALAATMGQQDMVELLHQHGASR